MELFFFSIPPETHLLAADPDNMNHYLRYENNLCDNSVAKRRNCLFNPLPNGKILDWSKLKAFADDKKKT